MHGIVLSAKKISLAKTKIEFLGMWICNGQIGLQEHILLSLEAFPDIIPDKKQLQRFLGCLNYIIPFYKWLAIDRLPLQKMLRKDGGQWTQEQTVAVQKIKEAIKNLPHLTIPGEEEILIIETDASDEFWGAVLLQKGPDGSELICAFRSGLFQGAEKNYHSIEKEILAVKRAIQKLELYIINKEFVIRTDNKNFKTFCTRKIDKQIGRGRLARWQEFFSQYDFTVEWKAGKDNILADTLTREAGEYWMQRNHGILFPDDGKIRQIQCLFCCQKYSNGGMVDPVTCIYCYNSWSPTKNQGRMHLALY